MSFDWPFSDPKNVAVFTSATILDGKDWIHFVTHDEDDGAWQFHPYRAPTSEADACIVSLELITQLDPRVTELADLPCGWQAWRAAPDKPWQRRRSSSAKPAT